MKKYFTAPAILILLVLSLSGCAGHDHDASTGPGPDYNGLGGLNADYGVSGSFGR